jgi:NAD(P)-dependent dehydrogenase (short-subunit alcohol dehydrogenase family)
MSEFPRGLAAFSLQGRKALITGGNRGLGYAFTRALADCGASVAFIGRSTDANRTAVERLAHDGVPAHAISADLSRDDDVQRGVDEAVEALGGLDIVVNNAARQRSLPDIQELTTELLDWTLKTNVYALVWLTKAALAHLGPGSAIINTTSVVAYDPPENLVDYSMTKAAVMNFTKSMAKQLASRQIRVNGVAPGPIWTPLQPSGGQDPKKLPQFGADTPMGRPGQPAELASLYVLLASREATYSTGQIFGAVGGRGGP